MDLIREIRETGLELDKEKGQNLTADPELAKGIAKAIPRGVKVFEAGAGLGFLTREIAKQAKLVIAVEIDKRFAPYLQKLPKNVKVIIGNALEEMEKGEWDILVSNTPYLITEALLRRLSRLWKPAIISVPIQQAETLLARPTADRQLEPTNTSCHTASGFTKLSLYTQGSFEVEKLFGFPKDATYPESTVPGVVLRLKPRINASYLQEKAGFFARFFDLHETMKLKNGTREGLIEYKKSITCKPMTKNQAREVLKALETSMGIKDYVQLMEKTPKQIDINTLHHIVVQLAMVV